MASTSDVLTEIAEENLPTLVTLYEKHLEEAPHVAGLIHTSIKWKNSDKPKSWVRFLSLGDSWKTDGTVIVIMSYYCYNVFIFSLDEQCTNLRRGLCQTSQIDYGNPLLKFFCLHEKHIPLIQVVAAERNLKISFLDDKLFMYVLRPQNAKVDINHNTDVYLKKLEPKHALQIDSVWPHRYPGSEHYLATLIEMNGGVGLFLQSTGELVSWVVKHCFGHIGVLQTDDNYKRRGYSVVVTKALSKEILEEGNQPFATVFVQNAASIRLFEKLGFEKIGLCVYLSVEKL